ncbi:MAG TPA: exo-alpha-sialidase [Chthonomonadales bacterium]|nr:exo-alpha-sialidase [Chthonomonadales bacterium]
MITNCPVWIDGKPALWPDVRRPPVERALLYSPSAEWTFSHHAHLAFYEGRWVAIWSNGRKDEDAPGQRVLISTSGDFRLWSEPEALAAPARDADGRERVLTAAGFHQHAGVLVAYYGDYGPEKQGTRLWAVTTRDLERWSDPIDLGVPVNPNHGPQRTASGRLIVSGNIAFPYTDDRAGLTGWKMAGLYRPGMAGLKDDPRSFWDVAKDRGWPSALCEGSFIQLPDGTLRMLLRATGPGFAYRLWVTESRDDGETWSAPALTSVSDCDAKFHLGPLPDGRYYYVGNPIAGNRTPLVVSLSEDGALFNRHSILGEEPYSMARPGRAKGGEYGYPHSVVHDGWLQVIVSRQKEGVEVLRVRLADL